MRPFIVGLLVFALSLQVSHCLVCRVCSYFPNYFAYLKDKLREKINDAQNDDTSQAKLQTIFSIDYAADKPNITCLNESDTSVHFEGCNALLNACVRQVVFSLDPRKKEPAIVYSCAKIAKVGCMKLNDTDSHYEMCACNTNNCSTTSQEKLRSRLFADTEELPSLDKSIIVIISAIVTAIFKCL